MTDVILSVKSEYARLRCCRRSNLGIGCFPIFHSKVLNNVLVIEFCIKLMFILNFPFTIFRVHKIAWQDFEEFQIGDFFQKNL